MNNIEKEFIPYEQVLDLEELGFNEKCFLTLDYTGNLYFCNGDYATYETDEGGYKNIEYKYNIPEKYKEIKIPTFSQAFRWLYQKLSIEKGVIPLDTESQQLLLKELIDKVSSKHLLV